jgi:pimeloyl-ACP methyl ester carboxylesterase
MRTAVSADGTKIAFDQTGQGPPVILVVGAFNERATGAPLAKALESQLTVLNYDRRGRGASGDTKPYAVEREVDDLDSLIREAGGVAHVFGYSSGAILALEGAARGLNITKLALYDAPFIVGDDIPRPARDIADRLAKLVESGRRGEAVELFQTEKVRIPEQVVAQYRQAPFRPALEAIAHTLVYDASIVGDQELPTAAKLRSIKTPTLVVYGSESPAFMGNSANALAKALPGGRVRALDGQSHDIVPAALAPVLLEFFGG